MLFETFGDQKNPAVLFFHAMGVTGESSEQVAKYLQDRYFCILPTSTVYCKGQKYVSKADEIRQVEDYLHGQDVNRLAMVVASSIGADLAMAFLTQTKLPTLSLTAGSLRKSKRYAPHHDAVSVFCHQEPVLVEGRYAEKDPVV